MVLCGAHRTTPVEAIDMSFNALGNRARPFVSRALAKALHINRTLTHLDLSHNHLVTRSVAFSADELQPFSFGLHLEGNAAFADARGAPAAVPFRQWLPGTAKPRV